MKKAIKVGGSLTGVLLRTAARVAFYTGYGAWCVTGGLVSGARRLPETRRLLAPTLRCPACSYENETHGRFQCHACSGIYVGWVGSCEICRSSARAYPCENCGASVPLRKPRV